MMITFKCFILLLTAAPLTMAGNDSFNNMGDVVADLHKIEVQGFGREVSSGSGMAKETTSSTGGNNDGIDMDTQKQINNFGENEEEARREEIGSDSSRKSALLESGDMAAAAEEQKNAAEGLNIGGSSKVHNSNGIEHAGDVAMAEMGKKRRPAGARRRKSPAGAQRIKFGVQTRGGFQTRGARAKLRLLAATAEQTESENVPPVRVSQQNFHQQGPSPSSSGLGNNTGKPTAELLHGVEPSAADANEGARVGGEDDATAAAEVVEIPPAATEMIVDEANAAGDVNVPREAVNEPPKESVNESEPLFRIRNINSLMSLRSSNVENNASLNNNNGEAQSGKRKRQWSRVWRHFVNNNGLVQCNGCQYNRGMPGDSSTAPFIGHLKSHHEGRYADFLGPAVASSKPVASMLAKKRGRKQSNPRRFTASEKPAQKKRKLNTGGAAAPLKDPWLKDPLANDLLRLRERESEGEGQKKALDFLVEEVWNCPPLFDEHNGSLPRQQRQQLADNCHQWRLLHGHAVRWLRFMDVFENPKEAKDKMIENLAVFPAVATDAAGKKILDSYELAMELRERQMTFNYFVLKADFQEAGGSDHQLPPKLQPPKWVNQSICEDVRDAVASFRNSEGKAHLKLAKFLDDYLYEKKRNLLSGIGGKLANSEYESVAEFIEKEREERKKREKEARENGPEADQIQ